MQANQNPFAQLVRGITVDTILDGSVKIIQPAKGYRIAIDPIFLAAATPIHAGAKILDVGCGVGAAGFCVLARAKKQDIANVILTGVDTQKILIDHAVENAALNEFTGQSRFIHADIANPSDTIMDAEFDHVFTNPPYLSAKSADPSPDPSKATANIESTADLAAWIEFCARKLKPKGSLTMIHRADRAGEIMALLPPDCWTVALFPLWPKLGQEAKRIIIQAYKRPGAARILPGLVLHETNGSYTQDAAKIVKSNAALDFAADPA